MTHDPESALDLILDPNREVPEDVESAVAVFMAAHRELAALRQRCEDAEMLFRAVFGVGGVPWTMITFEGPGIAVFGRTPNRWSFRRYIGHDSEDQRKRDLFQPVEDDGTGLPILTPEARSALKEE